MLASMEACMKAANIVLPVPPMEASVEAASIEASAASMKDSVEAFIQTSKEASTGSFHESCHGDES